MTITKLVQQQGVKRPLEEGDRGGGGGEAEQGGKKYKPDLASLPTRQYLDQTVVPILLQVTHTIAWPYFH